MCNISIDNQIPAYVRAVIDALKKGGKRAYLVGGSLRDLLRDVAPHDFDLTTNATPDEMLQILTDFHVVPTGLSHGTLTVISEGQPIEVTTHRMDGNYRDSRHPDSVFFTHDLKEDLRRRDFTINAIAWDEENGIIDPFGGQKDLQQGIIRAVGNPTKRFTEDALRILRCFRFAAQLDFTIDKATAQSAAACAAGLSRISVERIFSELTRTLCSPAVHKGLHALLESGCEPYVFFDIVPDKALLPRLQELPADAALRLAALCHGESTEALMALCRRWHAPNAFINTVTACLSALREQPPISFYEARRFVCHHFPYFEQGLALIRVIRNIDTANALRLCRTVLRDRTAVELRRLAVNGKELQEKLGVRTDMTGQLLLRLQDIVWQAPEKNNRSTLLHEAMKICREETRFHESH